MYRVIVTTRHYQAVVTLETCVRRGDISAKTGGRSLLEQIKAVHRHFLRLMFERFDNDGSGCLDVEEILKLSMSLVRYARRRPRVLIYSFPFCHPATLLSGFDHGATATAC